MFSWAIGRTSCGLKNEFELAMVNEPSVFELLRFDCFQQPIYSMGSQRSLWTGTFLSAFSTKIFFSWRRSYVFVCNDSKQKYVFGHMRAANAKIGLRICTVWPGPLLSAYRITLHWRMYQRKAKKTLCMRGTILILCRLRMFEGTFSLGEARMLIHLVMWSGLYTHVLVAGHTWKIFWQFYKGVIFCDILIAFPHVKSLLKRVCSKQWKVCSSWEQILLF